MRTAIYNTSRSFFLGLVVACAPAIRVPGPPTPIPAIPEQEEEQPPSNMSWSFAYRAGVSSYRVTREASIENQTDSGTTSEATSNVTHELLSLERIGDTIQFVIAADTFATTAHNPARVVQTPMVPARLTGSWVNDSLKLVADTVSGSCSPVQSALASDLHNLLTVFPTQLTRGMTWSDSVRITGCQGMIPTVAQISRVYTVSGDTLYEGSSLVVVQRRDSIEADGEGAQQQHQLHLAAAGTGTALYYLDPATGRVTRLTTTQEIGMTVTASGKSHRFKQNLKQEFVVAR